MGITAEGRQKHTELVLGFRVDRATASLPQTTDDALFTISGGRVQITQIVGEVRCSSS